MEKPSNRNANRTLESDLRNLIKGANLDRADIKALTSGEPITMNVTTYRNMVDAMRRAKDALFPKDTRTTKPPRDVQFLACVRGVPFTVVAWYNGAEDCFCFANPQMGMVAGVWNDTYFENEHAFEADIVSWIAMPDL